MGFRLVAASHFGVVACQVDVGVALHTLAAIAHLDVGVLIDTIEAVALPFVDGVVTPEGIDKETLHDGLLGNLWGVDRIEQIGIVEEDRCGLLGEVFSFFIDKIDQTCFFKILEIVHHRGARCADFFGKAADVGSGGVVHSEEVEQFLDALEIFEFDLLDEQDVDFDHCVHGAQKLLCEVAALQEEGIVSVMEVLLEILPGSYFGEDALEDRLVVFEELLESVGTEILSCAQIDVFTEGETMQPILLCKGVELGVVVFATAHRSCGIDDAQIRKTVVAFDNLLAPIR